MIRTFDFLSKVNGNDGLKKKIIEAMRSEENAEICIDIWQLLFKSDAKTVIIRPLAVDSKIISKEVTYKAVSALLAGAWDRLGEDDIRDIEG